MPTRMPLVRTSLDISALGITAATFNANVAITAIGATGNTLVTITGVGTIQVNGANNNGALAQRVTIDDFILAP